MAEDRAMEGRFCALLGSALPLSAVGRSANRSLRRPWSRLRARLQHRQLRPRPSARRATSCTPTRICSRCTGWKASAGHLGLAQLWSQYRSGRRACAHPHRDLQRSVNEALAADQSLVAQPAQRSGRKERARRQVAEQVGAAAPEGGIPCAPPSVSDTLDGSDTQVASEMSDTSNRTKADELDEFKCAF